MIKIIKLVLVVLIIFFIWFGYNVFASVSIDKTIWSVEISPDQNISEISQLLKNDGLIRQRFVFEKLVWLKDRHFSIAAGIYQLSPSFNTRQIVNLLISGQGLSKERTITVIEGWTNAQIGQMLEKTGATTAVDFQTAAGWPATFYFNKNNSKPLDFSDQFEFLRDKPVSVGLEGYLYPDTYRIFNNSTDGDIIVKMLKNFQDKAGEQLSFAVKNKQFESIFEIVTLASIVEKEAATTKDRRMIADIFLRRIQIKMPLQSDATVNYITSKGLTRPSREDTLADNPYNTYKYLGLPLAPICNPSIDAIEAVINPLANDYLYFLADETGQIIYSHDYEEHQINIHKYFD